MLFDNMETPRLVLDRGRVKQNAERFLARANNLGVALRPHLKTSKSLDVAAIAKGGKQSGVTVSTLREAAYFAENDYKDILYSTGVTPNKFAEVKRIYEETGECILLITDSMDVAKAAVEFSQKQDCPLTFLIEIDSGEHRSGLPVGDGDIVEIAKTLVAGSHTHFCGVMTHAGHSYGARDMAEVLRIAEDERLAVVNAAEQLKASGINCDIVSVGSSPTFMQAEHLEGVTEARAGVYLFWDMFQLGRGTCSWDDVALTVLASVIGHNRQEKTILIDAGGLALSKDIGAGKFLHDAGYGYVCDALSVERFGNLSVNVVHQEHGSITVDDPKWFDRLPVGSLVRVMPNHACMTAAAYQSYTVIEDGELVGTWPRINGWFD